jgi:predicted HAD superfamily Cof-like phosphohydrolase
MSYFRDVQKFHKEVLLDPEWDEPNLLDKRVDFMQEELDEFILAVGSNDVVGMADALADLVYVALGTADILDFPFDDIWAAVQGANMRKVPGPTKRGNKVDAMKPEGWVGPEATIDMLIRKHHEAK